MRSCQFIFLSQHGTPVTSSVTTEKRTHRLFSCQITSHHGRDLGIQRKKLQFSEWWHHVKATVEQDHCHATWAHELEDARRQTGRQCWDPRRQVRVLGPQEEPVGVTILSPCFLGAGAKCKLITTLFPCISYGNSTDLLLFCGGDKWLLPFIIKFKKQWR